VHVIARKRIKNRTLDIFNKSYLIDFKGKNKEFKIT